jgi:hypothetical protein
LFHETGNRADSPDEPVNGVVPTISIGRRHRSRRSRAAAFGDPVRPEPVPRTCAANLAGNAAFRPHLSKTPGVKVCENDSHIPNDGVGSGCAGTLRPRIIGPHVHVAIIVGLGTTLYAAIYVLFPLLTNGVKLYSQWMANVHFWGTLVGRIGMGAFMGMAGLQGMLRRTIYMEGEFTPYMWLAGISGALILIGFIFFMINIIMSVGLKGLLGIFTKSKLDTKDLVPAP